jgi:hypothetical protein
MTAHANRNAQRGPFSLCVISHASYPSHTCLVLSWCRDYLGYAQLLRNLLDGHKVLFSHCLALVSQPLISTW